MRWLTLPSDFSGEDWREVSLVIDRAMATTGLDLAEEAVYLLYDSGPESVLNGRAQCKIARSVIGPKKTPESPLELMDWKAASVIKRPLQGQTWDDLFSEAIKEWQDLEIRPKVFMLCIHRSLNPDLTLLTEAIFAE